MTTTSHTTSPNAKPAFTLIELLIVVGILAVLTSILIPALSKAREQARRVVCMSNQRTIAQAVHGFAAEHRGFGQALPANTFLIGTETGAARFQDRYVYDIWPATFTGPEGTVKNRKALAAWPIAYANYLGAPGLRSGDFFAHLPDGQYDADSVADTEQSLERKKQVPVLQCPAQPDAFGFVDAIQLFSGRILARMSYKINRDIFALQVYGEYRGLGHTVWRRGPDDARPLSGELQRVVRPDKVLMFSDGGAKPGQAPPALWLHSGYGPNLSEYAGAEPPVGYRESLLWKRLPQQRHSSDGGLVGVHVDGHADYFRPIGWKTFEGIRVATKFSPDPRITPYEPGILRTSRRGGLR